MQGAAKQCVFRRLREGQEGAVEEARLTPAAPSSGQYGTGGSLTFDWRWADDRAVPGTVRMLATSRTASGARNGGVTSERRRNHQVVENLGGGTHHNWCGGRPKTTPAFVEIREAKAGHCP